MVPSYDYNFDNSPREDSEGNSNNIPNEISDYPVSPLENCSPTGGVISSCINVAGKLLGF